MGRRIANQVHHQVSRLMRSPLIKEEPKWYQPVLNFPPLPLPPKAPPPRTSYDQKMKPISQTKLRRPKNRPLPIYYIEDDIRRQFYADHPFEAFRPTTLVEKGDIELHAVNGKGWTRLRQRGRNPTPEDAIQFTLNLHLHAQEKISLSEAYVKAVAQFRALRSEHHVATTFAAMEAEYLGASFVRGEIEHAFEKEKRALTTWDRLAEMDEGSLIARKRWKMIAEAHEGETNWSKGVQYVKMWQQGNRVNYAPALTEDIDELDEEETGKEEDASEDIEGPSEGDEGDEGDELGPSSDSGPDGILTQEGLELLIGLDAVEEASDVDDIQQ